VAGSVGIELLSKNDRLRLAAITTRRSADAMQLALIRRRNGLRPHECQEQIVERADVEAILAAVEPGYLEKKRPQYIPRWINRRRLREDINACLRRFHLHEFVDDDALGNNRLKRLEQFTRLADDLLRFMGSDCRREELAAIPVAEDERDPAGRVALDLVAPYFHASEGWPGDDGSDDPSVSLYGLQQGLLRLAIASQSVLKAPVRDGEGNIVVGADGEPIRAYQPRALLKQPRNAGADLVGRHLPRIFERWFGCKAGAGRPHPDGEPSKSTADTPFVRFAVAVLKDLNGQDRSIPVYTPNTVETLFHTAQRGESKRGPKTHRRKLIRAAGT